MKYIFIFITFIPAQVSAHQKDYSFPPNSMIEIEAYDATKQVYELTYLKYPRQGPFFATPKQLATAVGAIELSRIRRAPTSILHQQFKTDKTIPLVPDAKMASQRRHNH